MNRDCVSTAALQLVSLAASGRAFQVDDPWRGLTHETAWVLVGMLSPKTDDWLTQLHHRVRGANASETLAVPRKGDVIEVLDKGLIEFHILDFATKGEARRMDPPGAERRVLSRADTVGIRLEIGTLLLVADVHTQALKSTGDREVWLRVIPAVALPKR